MSIFQVDPTLRICRLVIQRPLGSGYKQNKGQLMSRTFNAIMRVVSSLIGVAIIMMGIVWMLQGLNLAFRVGFMVNQPQWTVYGALLAIVGVAQVVWSNTRQTRP
jgi:hypothetical protein